MTVHQVSKKPAGYTEVKFHNPESKKFTVYQIPVGSKISTKEAAYKVKADGIYSKGKKIGDIDVTLAEIVALGKYDVNKDRKIDKKDAAIYDTKTAKNPNVLADSINSGLKILPPKDRIFVKAVRDGDGSFSNAGSSEEGFSTIFGSELQGGKTAYLEINFAGRESK